MKFVKIYVAKEVYSEVYIEVPDDFDVSKATHLDFVEACEVTLDSCDWSDADISFKGAEFVPKEEAENFSYWAIQDQGE
jgi:hypothetical protein